MRFILKDRKGNQLAYIEGKRVKDEVRVKFSVKKNMHIFISRFERQIKKYQSCGFGCIACKSICPHNAIIGHGEDYKIDEDKCTRCQKCVTGLRTGCIVANTLNISASRR